MATRLTGSGGHQHTMTKAAIRVVAVMAAASMLFAGLALTTPDQADARVRECRGGKGQVVVNSQFDFEETWDRLISALDANPNIKIIKVIDHAAAAANVELDLDPNRVVVFGNPALGSPIMAVNPEAGIDLPQKMQVWADDGRVCVGYNAVSYLQARHSAAAAPTLDTIAGALSNFATVASGADPTGKRILNAWVRNNDRIITEPSNADFETTWNRLLTAIDSSPAEVAFTVDHGANSGGVLGPLRLVVFGNPNIGTPIMQARPTAGIDLPLKMLVWEADDGTVYVTTNDADLLRRRHRMGSALDTLTPVIGATGNFLRVATLGPPVL